MDTLNNMLQRIQVLIIIILTMTSLNVGAVCDHINPEDPLKEANRFTFYFNSMIFALYIRPAAAIFNLLPLPVKESVNNFIQNIRTVPYTANSFLQGKFDQGGKSALRFIVNSTLGVGGLFDPASDIGLLEKIVTLGDTFYTWGWKESSYLVVPLVGPSTIRDAWGLTGDYFMTPSAYFPPDVWNPYYLAILVNTNYRSQQIQNLVSIAGVHDYDFVRSSYLQHRRYELTGEIPSLEHASELQGPPA